MFEHSKEGLRDSFISRGGSPKLLEAVEKSAGLRGRIAPRHSLLEIQGTASTNRRFARKRPLCSVASPQASAIGNYLKVLAPSPRLVASLQK